MTFEQEWKKLKKQFDKIVGKSPPPRKDGNAARRNTLYVTPKTMKNKGPLPQLHKKPKRLKNFNFKQSSIYTKEI